MNSIEPPHEPNGAEMQTFALRGRTLDEEAPEPKFNKNP